MLAARAVQMQRTELRPAKRVTAAADKHVEQDEQASEGGTASERAESNADLAAAGQAVGTECAPIDWDAKG
jgi:hypothetical protein